MSLNEPVISGGLTGMPTKQEARSAGQCLDSPNPASAELEPLPLS